MTFLIVSLLLAFRVVALGQEPAKAVLVDEFNRLPCDDFLGRLDVFFAELRVVPESNGVVVIRNPAKNRHESVAVQEMVKAHFIWRGWKQKPLSFVRADGDDGQLVQLWRIPPGAAFPSIDGELRSFRLAPDVTEPFILAVDLKLGPQMCPEIDDRGIFASFMKDNPAARGNIVVRSRTTADARSKVNRIVRSLATKYGVPRHRLRTFTAKLQKPWNQDEPVVEYWYLP